MENTQILSEIGSMNEMVKAIKTEAEKQSRDYGALTANIDQKMADFAATAEGKSSAEITAFKKEMQDQFDMLATKASNKPEAKSQTIAEGIEEALSGINFKEGLDNELTSKLRSDRKFRIELPNVKAMGLNNLTGDPVATYSVRQAIQPAQKINFRDLIPTVNSETGLYVFYREPVNANNIAVQSEGSTKAENTYNFSEVKVVQNYLAGFATFTKQMATSLPWLQNTLPRLLMRDFFKKENAAFFSTVSTAATAVTSSETDNVKKIIDFVASQMDLNFNVSFGLVSNAMMASLLKSTYTNGYYSGAGGLTLNASGTGVTIFGVPILPASWVTNNKVLLIDSDYLERVQVKGLAIELSYENGTNFVQNLVTARIECQEEINLMLATSAAYGTLA
jgi:hypothetical protein